jgi:hypothetical protein
MATATRRGITDPVERYRHLAIHYHGMKCERLAGYMRSAEAAVRDGHWPDMGESVAPELVVGRAGADLIAPARPLSAPGRR